MTVALRGRLNHKKVYIRHVWPLCWTKTFVSTKLTDSFHMKTYMNTNNNKLLRAKSSLLSSMSFFVVVWVFILNTTLTICPLGPTWSPVCWNLVIYTNTADTNCTHTQKLTMDIVASSSGFRCKYFKCKTLFAVRLMIERVKFSTQVVSLQSAAWV